MILFFFITVKVKWGKKKLEGVEVNMEESPLVFKSQLFTLTGVPPERQKVMIGGTTVGDEEWGKCASKIKPVSDSHLHQTSQLSRFDRESHDFRALLTARSLISSLSHDE